MTLDLEVTHARALGRYTLYDVIASGGMASVHFGRLAAAAGFARTVAIKRLHAHHARDPDFVAMFTDEARLAARIRHPNVIPTLDVVAMENELFLVMEYVEGESLARLLRTKPGAAPAGTPAPIACAILAGVLRGLHAAHQATGENGEPLRLVHRDVSPQNILVGTDGIARICDFGIAKATTRLQQTATGKIKGKLGYIAPEQLRGKAVTQRADLYAAAIVLWEMLTGRRLFHGDSEGEIMEQVLLGAIGPPSRLAPDLPLVLDDIALRGSAMDPEQRYSSAAEMATALEQAGPTASTDEIGAWVRARAADELARKAKRVAQIESESLIAVRHLSPARKWPARAVGLGVLVAAGLLLASRLSRRPPALETAARPSSTASAPSPSETPVTPPRASAEGSSASAQADSAGDAPPPKLPSAQPVAADPGPTAQGSKSAAHRPRSHGSLRADCKPPYVRDANGRIHWKIECL